MCSQLRITDDNAFATRMRQAYFAFEEAERKERNFVHWRVFLDYTRNGKPMVTEKTWRTMIAVLNKAGFPADNAWLQSEGNQLPFHPRTALQVINPGVAISPEEQLEISDRFGGFYCLYRPHGGADAMMVRELVYVSRSSAVNAPIYLINRRGALYTGTSHVSNRVLYADFSRPHTKFNFVCRDLKMVIPNSGSSNFIGGRVSRIHKTAERPADSACIMVKIKDAIELDDTLRFITAHAHNTAQELEIYDVEQKLSGSLRPREFATIADMSDQEVLIHKNLGDVVLAPDPLKLDSLRLKMI